MLNPPSKKLCKDCNKNPTHPGRRSCLDCINASTLKKAKEQKAKDRAKERINVRLSGVDESERDSLREKVRETIGPFLKNKQIIVKVSRGKTSSERGKLIKELDRVFSLYIRKRDGNKCVMCGSTEQVQNGHLLSRVNLSTRFDEINCNAQCATDNINHERDSKPYTDWFIKNYGIHMYDDLRERWHSKPFKVTNDWLREQIQFYKSKL